MSRLRPVPVYLCLAVSASSLFALYGTLSGIYRIQAAGLDPLQLVLVGTALEFSVFVFEVPTGVVADVYSRRLSAIIGYVLIGCGFLLESRFPTFVTILLAQVVWGLGYTFTSGAVQAWIVDEIHAAEDGDRSSVGKLFLRGSQLGQVGALVGIALATALGSIALYLPLFAAGCGVLALAAFLALVMPERGFRPRPREERSSWRAMGHTFLEGSRVVRARPALVLILGVALFEGISSEPLDRLWELHFLTNFTLPALWGATPVVWFGGMGALSLLIGIAATGLLRRHLDVDDARVAIRALIWLNGLVVAAVLVFALAGSFATALCAYLTMRVLRRLCDPIVLTWANQQIPSEVRATVLSMHTQSNSFGQFAGGPALGALAQASGVRAAFLATASMLVPVQALYLRAARLSRRRPSR